MRKAEAFQLPNAQQTQAGFNFDTAAHGFDGRVAVGEPNPLLGTALQFAYQDAVRDAVRGGRELRTRIDFSSGDPNGAGLFQYAILPSPNASASGNNRRWCVASLVCHVQL